MPSSTQIDLAAATWVKITDSDKEGSIRHHSGNTTVIYTEAPATPTEFTKNTPVMETTTASEGFPYWGVSIDDSIYAYAISEDAVIVVSPKGA